MCTTSVQEVCLTAVQLLHYCQNIEIPCTLHTESHIQCMSENRTAQLVCVPLNPVLRNGLE